MRKHKVRAVHDDDLLGLLDSIGLRHSIEIGQVNCCVCGIPITIETIQALVPQGKNIAVLCSKVTCIKQLESDMAESNHG